jgi:dienelactone hydrolase
MRRLLAPGAILIIGLLLAGFVVLARGADYPAPSGPEAVGRTTLRWVDASRPETMTDAEDDTREIIVHLWYPAKSDGDAVRAAYVPDLGQLSGAIRASGAISPVELFGLRFVQTHAFADVPMSDAEARYPVLLFSPGNVTNSAYYSTIIEELVSHGYVVAAIDHPYDVTAVVLSNGQVAAFAEEKWPVVAANADKESVDANMRFYLERVNARAEDARFVLNQLERLNTETDGKFKGRLDLSNAGIMGHSVGGITASRACELEPRFRACLNLDGHYASSPFYPTESGVAPEQPFMLIATEDDTREPPDEVLARWGITRDEWREERDRMREQVTAMYRSVRSGSYQVIIPRASHDSFTDGPTLLPAPLNREAEQADRILRIASDYTLAFFDKSLKGQSVALLDGPSAAHPEVMLRVYTAR